MEKDNAGKFAAVGAGSLLGTALALFLSRKAEAAPPDGTISLDDAAMSALLAIAQEGQVISGLLQDIAIALGAPGSITENPNDFVCFPVTVTTPGTPQRFPEHKVPYKIKVVLKAPFTNTNYIYIGRSQAEVLSPQSRYYLLPNETVALEVDNTRHIYADAVVASEGVICIVEKRGVGSGD